MTTSSARPVLDRPLSRRLFLRGSALIGCSAAAFPWMTSVTLAAAPFDERLVVIILRGAMDGIDVVRPVGDPNYAGLRSADMTGTAAPLPLDGFYALHPALAELMPMWKAGELAFAHAVSTPYRDKRSHFDGQDILEAGTGLDVPDTRIKDGWLNRMLQAVPAMSAQTAYAVGRDEMKVIEGKADVMSWAPDTRLQLSEQSRTLLEAVYHDDPLFRDASAEAMDIVDRLKAEQAADGGGTGSMTGGMANGMMAGKKARPGSGAQLAAFTAARLREETRIAAFSISGWDTHRAQHGVLANRLTDLAATLRTLRAGLGPVWDKTTVLAMTEFGRTARENGTRGTDHGTGGAMIMAGGALRGGKVYGTWPGLTEADLFERRDLMPTADVRSYAAWAMRGLYGFDKHLLETTVFPGLDMGGDPKIIA
ncbi:DUF1501 domain-containing protein [Acidimangrovimonas pyrenivorans]|uniref:DUF1501 domain-containing protein n=1 Tax=Acidimangrovimonas pyrenivorans TaxID=2030798 RepID=A0ABV7AP36_9RHOB